jgi:hypothetical protein
MRRRPDPRISEVVRHLRPATGFKPWHGGPTAIGTLRGVTAKLASWRPYPDRHTIWELALHVAYWNYVVERRLTDGPRGEFGRAPANWPRTGAADDEAAWRADRSLLRAANQSLADAIEAFDPGRLDEIATPKGNTSYADLVTGVLLHDTYHAGQIQLMKRLARSHFS